ncbi:hypothetical protein BDV29DRAFT_158747 [Aspergillus leporis]|jgi:hypothetical protein|uniref:NADPH-dependent FMN reductase-like domain-containing protein n=1 Tax=Aspergillus leporis TaxID=41062 RepID=A0A5N5WUP1_9EURO|nr:hypothetical protein BDV29DRAFT_158747 [Aspergillus leporis]
MHILGIANGTINGNSEILLKAALQAAQARKPSISSSWIHAPSMSIPRNPRPLPAAQDISLGTVACTGETHGEIEEQENVPDGRRHILEAILNADGLTIATPVYSHQPAGFLKAVIDRILGPFTGAAFVQCVLEGQHRGDPKVDKRILQPRVVGFISCFRVDSERSDYDGIADDASVCVLFACEGCGPGGLFRIANPGAVMLNEDRAIERAQQLGQNVASQMGKTFDEAVYLGPRREGDCPYCHLSKVEIDHTPGNDIGCVTCGTRGKMIVGECGRIRLVWEPDSNISCITIKGKLKHVDDTAAGDRRGSVILEDSGDPYGACAEC